MHHQAEQEQQHEEGTRVEGVQPGEDQGENGQGESRGIEPADERQSDRHRLRGCRLIVRDLRVRSALRQKLGVARFEALAQEIAGGVVALVALKRTSAVEEGRDVACLGAELPGQRDIELGVFGLRHLQRPHVEPRQLLFQGAKEA